MWGREPVKSPAGPQFMSKLGKQQGPPRVPLWREAACWLAPLLCSLSWGKRSSHPASGPRPSCLSLSPPALSCHLGLGHPAGSSLPRELLYVPQGLTEMPVFLGLLLFPLRERLCPCASPLHACYVLAQQRPFRVKSCLLRQKGEARSVPRVGEGTSRHSGQCGCLPMSGLLHTCVPFLPSLSASSPLFHSVPNQLVCL